MTARLAHASLLIVLSTLAAMGCATNRWPAPLSGKAEDLAQTLNSEPYARRFLTIEAMKTLRAAPGSEETEVQIQAGLVAPLEKLIPALGLAGDQALVVSSAIVDSIVKKRVDPTYFAPVYVFHPGELLDMVSLRDGDRVEVERIEQILAWKDLTDRGTARIDLKASMRSSVLQAIAEAAKRSNDKSKLDQAAQKVDKDAKEEIDALAAAYSRSLVAHYTDAVDGIRTEKEVVATVVEKTCENDESLELLSDVTARNVAGSLQIDVGQGSTHRLFLADGTRPRHEEIARLPQSSAVFVCDGDDVGRAPVLGILIFLGKDTGANAIKLRYYRLATWIQDFYKTHQLRYDWSPKKGALVPDGLVKWGFPEVFAQNFDGWLGRRDVVDRLATPAGGSTLGCGGFALEQVDAATGKTTSMELRRYRIRASASEIAFITSALCSDPKAGSATMVVARDEAAEFRRIDRGDDGKYHIATRAATTLEIAVAHFYDEPIHERDYFTLHITEFAREEAITKVGFLVGSTRRPNRALVVRYVIERSNALPPGMLLVRTAGVGGADLGFLRDCNKAIHAIATLSKDEKLLTANPTLLRAAQALPGDAVAEVRWDGVQLDEARNDCAFIVGPPEQ